MKKGNDCLQRNTKKGIEAGNGGQERLWTLGGVTKTPGQMGGDKV